MNHWLILLLTAVAMVAILVLFAWWWTTENWDWASAELKPPRTVPQETKGRPLSWAETEELKWKGRVADGLNDLTLQQLPSLEQRVTALEEDNRWHRTAAELLMNLEPRLAEVENVMNQIHKLEPPLPLAATPSPATESHIKGDSLGVERDSTTLPTLRFSPSDPRIIQGGPVDQESESAGRTYAST